VSVGAWSGETSREVQRMKLHFILIENKHNITITGALLPLLS
jgi:hypothetical protein